MMVRIIFLKKDLALLEITLIMRIQLRNYLVIMLLGITDIVQLGVKY